VAWEAAGAPRQWPVSDDPAVLAQIGRWLDEAGTAPSPARAVSRPRGETPVEMQP
jgi:hypothetical protein